MSFWGELFDAMLASGPPDEAPRTAKVWGRWLAGVVALAVAWILITKLFHNAWLDVDFAQQCNLNVVKSRLLSALLFASAASYIGYAINSGRTRIRFSGDEITEKTWSRLYWIIVAAVFIVAIALLAGTILPTCG